MFSNTVQYSRVMLSSDFCLATVSVCVSLYVHGNFTGASVKLCLGDFKRLRRLSDSKAWQQQQYLAHFRCSTKEYGKYLLQQK